jgi:hypothetical protein
MYDESDERPTAANAAGAAPAAEAPLTPALERFTTCRWRAPEPDHAYCTHRGVVSRLHVLQAATHAAQAPGRSVRLRARLTDPTAPREPARGGEPTLHSENSRASSTHSPSGASSWYALQ